MKQVILIASLTALVASSASASLVAAWDFQTTTNGGTAVTALNATLNTLPKVYVSNFGSGSLFLDGSNGSSNWFIPATGSTNSELNAFTGTALNADVGIGMSTTTTSPACLALVGGSGGSTGPWSANGKSAVFAFSMTNFQNLSISYATQRTATGFTTQTWEWSTDGTNWFSVGAVGSLQTNFALGTGSVTNLSTSGLDNAGTAFLKVTFTGATNGTGNNRLDNIQFNADVVPAPGALAILGVAGVIGSRRRRA